MKEIFKVICAVGLLMSAAFVYADETTDIFAPTKNRDIRIESDDGVTPTTFTVRARVNLSSIVYVLDGIAKVDVYDNLVAKSSITYVDVYISTTVLAAGASTFYIPEASQPTVARNIVCEYDMFKTTNSVYSNVTFVGKDAVGHTITETVIATHTQVATVRAFAWITYYTIGAATLSLDVQSGETDGNTTSGSVRFSIGTGDLIGFRGDLDNSNDFLGATVQDTTTKTQEKSLVTVNYLYDTWTHSDVPDGADDYYMYYLSHIR